MIYGEHIAEWQVTIELITHRNIALWIEAAEELSYNDIAMHVTM